MNERRYFSPEEKVKIVLEGLSGTVQVSELCRKYGITTTMF
ncbi:MAG: transposase [Candidatus Acidifodinimicrobium sp.]